MSVVHIQYAIAVSISVLITPSSLGFILFCYSKAECQQVKIISVLELGFQFLQWFNRFGCWSVVCVFFFLVMTPLSFFMLECFLSLYSLIRHVSPETHAVSLFDSFKIHLLCVTQSLRFLNLMSRKL